MREILTTLTALLACALVFAQEPTDDLELEWPEYWENPESVASYLADTNRYPLPPGSLLIEKETVYGDERIGISWDDSANIHIVYRVPKSGSFLTQIKKVWGDRPRWKFLDDELLRRLYYLEYAFNVDTCGRIVQHIESLRGTMEADAIAFLNNPSAVIPNRRADPEEPNLIMVNDDYSYLVTFFYGRYSAEARPAYISEIGHAVRKLFSGVRECSGTLLPNEVPLVR